MPIVQVDICEPEAQAGVDADWRAIDCGGTINVGVDRRTGAGCTVRIRVKGPEDEYQVQTMAQFTETIGHRILI